MSDKSDPTNITIELGPVRVVVPLGAAMAGFWGGGESELADGVYTLRLATVNAQHQQVAGAVVGVIGVTKINNVRYEFWDMVKTSTVPAKYYPASMTAFETADSATFLQLRNVSSNGSTTPFEDLYHDHIPELGVNETITITRYKHPVVIVGEKSFP
jgi:hypothetical protein